MDSIRRIAPRQWPVDWRRVEALFDELPGSAPAGWRRLSAWLCEVWTGCGAVPATVVVTGGQGAGKSTLTSLLVDGLTRSGARAVGLSLDDYYLSGAERARLARRIHPLLQTRGVPGTHDVEALLEDLERLRAPRSVRLRGFSKGDDEPLPRSRWRTARGPFDVVVLEGWCLGARPESAHSLRTPINVLERTEDPEGVWRGYVDGQLAGPYARLRGSDAFVMFLKVPDLAAVIRWRTTQDRALPPAMRMAPQELRRFVAHFERLTRALDRQLDGRCNLTVELGPRHGIRRLRPGRVHSRFSKVPLG